MKIEEMADGIVLGIWKKSYLKLAMNLQDIFLPCFMINDYYQGLIDY